MSDNYNQLHRTAPIRITGLRLLDVAPSENCATILWDQLDHMPEKFKVNLYINGGDMKSKETVDPFFVINQLTPGTKYSVQVSIEEKQYRSVSDLFHFQTAPGEVKNVKAEKTSPSSFILDWDRVAGAESYVVKWKGSQNEKEIATKTTDVILKDLPEGSIHLCSVAARNQGGLGIFSNSVKFCTDFHGPQNIQHRINYLGDDATIEIEFDALTDHNIVKYHVRLSTDCSSSERAFEETVEEPVATFRQVDLGVRYTPSVVAETVYGSKSLRSYGTSFGTRPGKVGTVRTYIESKTVQRVCWNSVKGAESYEVSYGCKSVNTRVENCQECNFLIMDLPPCCTFFVEVAAVSYGCCGKKSDKMFFNTALAPPTYMIMKDVSCGDDLRLHTFWEPCEGTSEYHIVLINVRKNDMRSRTVRQGTHHVFKDLEYGSEYYCKVQAIALSSFRNSSLVVSKSIWTRPHQVTAVKIDLETSTSRMVSWQSIYHAAYKLRLQRVGDLPTCFMTDQNEFHLENLCYNSTYFVSVTAKILDLEGKESERQRFETALDHPSNIRFENISKTAIAVRFDEPEVPAQHYRIKPISLHGTSPQEIIINRTEALKPITINGLAPGGVYQVAICSLHQNADLNSKDAWSTIIRTLMPALEVTLMEINNNGVKLEWDPLNGATSYKVYQRIEHGHWEEQKTDRLEVSFTNLLPGTKYEFKVSGISSSGEGEESMVSHHTTAPDSPSNLQAMYLSPVQVTIWCDKVKGAERYVFDIDGETFTKEQPEHLYYHNKEREILKISVFAVCAAQWSSCSEILLFEQKLLCLKKKYQKLATNNDKYIPPKFKNMDTVELDKNFETGKFDISQGETCLILGESCAGKTSACYNYMQSLPENKLGVYLDWSKIAREQIDEVEFLRRHIMMSYSQSVCDKSAWMCVFEWMKTHSDLVVFMIDNIDFPSDFDGNVVHNGDNTQSEHILYRLICEQRDLFKNSQVLCTSNSEHVKSIVKATKTLEIIGFDESHIKEMISSTFEELSVDEILPESTMYLCVNPGYCKNILQIWKSGSHIDLDSYSSLLVRILLVSMEQYSQKDRNSKWKRLADKIEQHRESLSTSHPASLSSPIVHQNFSITESETASAISDLQSCIQFYKQRNLDENTCKKLQKDIERALFYSYFCSHKSFNFKALMIEEGIVHVLVAGLLKEDCIQQLEMLFKIADKTLDDTMKKRNAMKTYIKKHIKKRIDEIYSNHEVTLHWLDVIAELNDEDLMKAIKRNIQIKNSLKIAAVKQVAEFFGKLPKRFFPYIEVTYAKDLSQEWSIIMELGIGKNQNSKMIKVNDKRLSTTPSRVGSTKRSSDRRTSVSSTNPVETDMDLHHGLKHKDANSLQG